MEIRTEGVVLKTFGFRDVDQIATLFTPDHGKVKVIVRGAYRPGRRGASVFLSPLTRVDCIYKQGRSELARCEEVSVYETYSRLRETLPLLEGACELLQMIDHTQMPGKAAPGLYELLLRYLGGLKEEHLLAFTSSFRLKVLRHEGLFAAATSCCRCSVELEEWHIGGGESHCAAHAPTGAVAFSAEEYAALLALAYGRSFGDLMSIPVGEPFHAKTQLLANDCFG